VKNQQRAKEGRRYSEQTQAGITLRYWADKFGISREQLRKVVREVGDNPQAVEDYLKGA